MKTRRIDARDKIGGKCGKGWTNGPGDKCVRANSTSSLTYGQRGEGAKGTAKWLAKKAVFGAGDVEYSRRRSLGQGRREAALHGVGSGLKGYLQDTVGGLGVPFTPGGMVGGSIYRRSRNVGQGRGKAALKGLAAGMAINVPLAIAATKATEYAMQQQSAQQSRRSDAAGKPRCKKGKPCGAICIPKDSDCREGDLYGHETAKYNQEFMAASLMGWVDKSGQPDTSKLKAMRPADRNMLLKAAQDYMSQNFKYDSVASGKCGKGWESGAGGKCVRSKKKRTLGQAISGLASKAFPYKDVDKSYKWNAKKGKKLAAAAGIVAVGGGALALANHHRNKSKSGKIGQGDEWDDLVKSSAEQKDRISRQSSPASPPVSPQKDSPRKETPSEKEKRTRKVSPSRSAKLRRVVMKRKGRRVDSFQMAGVMNWDSMDADPIKQEIESAHGFGVDEIYRLHTRTDGSLVGIGASGGEFFEFDITQRSVGVVERPDLTAAANERARGALAAEGIAYRGDSAFEYLRGREVRMDAPMQADGKCGKGWKPGPGGKCVRGKGMGMAAKIGVGLAGAAALGGAAYAGRKQLSEAYLNVRSGAAGSKAKYEARKAMTMAKRAAGKDARKAAKHAANEVGIVARGVGGEAKKAAKYAANEVGIVARGAGGEAGKVARRAGVMAKRAAGKDARLAAKRAAGDIGAVASGVGGEVRKAASKAGQKVSQATQGAVNAVDRAAVRNVDEAGMRRVARNFGQSMQRNAREQRRSR